MRVRNYPIVILRQYHVAPVKVASYVLVLKGRCEAADVRKTVFLEKQPYLFYR